jgi:hypothetical protein
MLDRTGNTLNVTSLQATNTTPPSFADLLLHLRLVASGLESGIYELDSIVHEFAGDVPDEIGDQVANISQNLETAVEDMECTLEVLAAANVKFK